MEFQLSNGATFVIDDRLNKIFVDSGQGVQEMNLDAALLAWANGDVAKASALRSRFRATLNDPSREMSLTSDQFQWSSSTWGSGTTCLSAFDDCGGGGGIESYSTPITDFESGGWGGYSFTFLAPAPDDDEDEEDRRDWERWREHHCGDAASSARSVVLAVPFTVAACASILACVGGALILANELNDWAEASTACKAPYPGPDGW